LLEAMPPPKEVAVIHILTMVTREITKKTKRLNKQLCSL
jgi:hypothetical protein